MKKRWIGILLGIGIIGLGAIGWTIFHFLNPPRVDFYPPPSPPVLLEETRRFFFHQQYFDLTSYVDQKLMSGVFEPKVRETLLFWQAESYFQLGQYALSQKQFSALFAQNPHFWQAKLRLLSIDIALDKPGDFLVSIRDLPVSDERYYWTGRFYETQHQTKKALEFYRKIPKEDSMASWRIGRLLFQDGRFSECTPFLERALSDTRLSRLELLKMLFHAYVAMKDHQNAIKYSNALKVYLENNPTLVREVGLELNNLGELDQARTIYTVLDTQTQLTQEFSSVLADLNYQLGDYPKVIRYSQNILLTDKAYLNLIDSYARLKQNRKILYLTKKDAQKRSPETEFTAHNYRALSYEELGDLRDAIKEREMMAQKNSHQADNLWQLGSLYVRVREKRKFSDLSSQLFTMEPQKFLPIVDMLMSLSLWQKAQELVSEVLSTDPSREDALFLQAKIYSAQNNWTLFEETLLKLVQSSPKDKQILYYADYSLGSLRLKEHRYGGSIEFLKEAKNIQESGPLSVKLALAYLLNGESVEAQRELDAIQDESLLSDEEKRIVRKINRELL